MKRDNRGLTLMELIIAIAMSTIIMGAAIMFISNALRSYRVASATIDLQMEAHVVMEQLGVWIMEGNYVVTEDDGTAKDTVLRQYAGGRKGLVVYCRPRPIDDSILPTGTTVNENGRVVAAASPGPGATPTKRVIWLENDGLYMLQETFGGEPEDDFSSYMIPADAAERKNCISPYVREFDYEWDNDRETYIVTLKLQSGTQEYTLRDEINMRNSYVAPSTPAPTTTP